MSGAHVESLAIPAVKLVRPTVHGDARGFFLERWNAGTPGLPGGWVQLNHSRSRRGALRGLHYQLSAHAQAKLVGVTRGAILDVAVDLRRGSPTFAQHVSRVLNDESHEQLLVPAGFAHGFLVLSDVADVLYLTDAPYAPAAERGVRWDDSRLAIDWGLAALGREGEPLLSAKDAALPALADAEYDFVYEGGS